MTGKSYLLFKPGATVDDGRVNVMLAEGVITDRELAARLKGRLLVRGLFGVWMKPEDEPAWLALNGISSDRDRKGGDEHGKKAWQGQRPGESEKEPDCA